MTIVAKNIIQVLLYEGGPVKKTDLAKFLKIKQDEVEENISEMKKLLNLLDLKLLENQNSLEISLSSEISALINKNKVEELKSELSESSLQTLAVIIYKDRATKAEIDFIRGVDSSRSIKNLQTRGIIESVMEKTRRVFSVTTETLKYLNVETIKSLQDQEEINAKLKTLIEGE